MTDTPDTLVTRLGSDIDWSADDNIGPIYRKRAPTVADYDEVIRDLQAARDDLAAQDWSKGCSVCGDSGCASNICHHNALVGARAWVRERGKHRCYHCGFVALTDEQAQEHFGTCEAEVAKCISDRLTAQSERVVEVLRELVGQVEQARDGFGIWPYSNSDSMKAALEKASSLDGKGF